jgi:hypothetical protein
MYFLIDIFFTEKVLKLYCYTVVNVLTKRQKYCCFIETNSYQQLHLVNLAKRTVVKYALNRRNKGANCCSEMPRPRIISSVALHKNVPPFQHFCR